MNEQDAQRTQKLLEHRREGRRLAVGTEPTERAGGEGALANLARLVHGRGEESLNPMAALSQTVATLVQGA